LFQTSDARRPSNGATRFLNHDNKNAKMFCEKKFPRSPKKVLRARRTIGERYATNSDASPTHGRDQAPSFQTCRKRPQCRASHRQRGSRFHLFRSLEVKSAKFLDLDRIVRSLSANSRGTKRSRRFRRCVPCSSRNATKHVARLNFFFAYFLGEGVSFFFFYASTGGTTVNIRKRKLGGTSYIYISRFRFGELGLALDEGHCPLSERSLKGRIHHKHADPHANRGALVIRYNAVNNGSNVSSQIGNS